MHIHVYKDFANSEKNAEITLVSRRTVDDIVLDVDVDNARM